MNITILKRNIEFEKEMLALCRKKFKALPKGSLSCYRNKNKLNLK